MAELESPQPNDHLAATFSDNTKPGLDRRGWRCPSDVIISTYLDGSVASGRRNRIQSHLANCEFCRHLIGDIVRAQRSEDALLPPGLLQRAIAQTKSQPRRLGWSLVPVAATLMITGMLFAALMLRTPSRVAIPTLAAPVAPEIAKTMPAPVLGKAVPDRVRKPLSVQVSPNVVSPRLNSVVAPERIEFKWELVPNARYYQLRLTSSDGDLVWGSQSEATGLTLPAAVHLRKGTYFVWVLAQLEDGQVRKSRPVRFQVTASR
jgi:hypothetical protein